MNPNDYIKTIIIIFLLMMECMGCKKLTQVGEPVSTITTEETFGTDATANSAIAGIYTTFWNNFYGSGKATFNLGLSADELHDFVDISRYELNTLRPDGNVSSFWADAYYCIYLSNAAIEALPASTGVSSSLKKQLTGEAKFLRAIFHFYLVNLFGDVPIVTTTAYRINDTLHRSQSEQVYQQIIDDLKDAQNLLSSNYSISAGQRIRVNKSAADALLARVYLYRGYWVNADAEASSVINNTSLYGLENNLNQVFLANSSEVILQLQTPNIDPYATLEGVELIPYTSTTNPRYYLTNELLDAFETTDLRRQKWVDSTEYSGVYYYYPSKYKVRIGQQGNITEYYMLLRLAEQYLIRAEAKAQQGDLSGAISDLNILRSRAQLPELPTSLNQAQVLAAISQERRIELFAEMGHRWLDLKRTAQADAILGPLKAPNWQSADQLFPIPSGELTNNPNLTQNAGY